VYQVGSGENTKVMPPIKVNITEQVRIVSVGLNFAFAVTESNKVMAWRPSFITEDDEAI
jgi:hypothetical protein